MNRQIFTLLLDYHRRTLGVWAILVFLQLMQMSTIWVFGTRHVPIVGAVMAALMFRSTWNSPQLVMRTLPIKTHELALLRWWEQIGGPMPFIVLGLVLSWFANDGSRFPTPPFLNLWVPVAASFATLGILSVLPLPVISAGKSNVSASVGWVALLLGSVYGVPMEWLPAPLPAVLLSGGSLLALISFDLARSGRVLQAPSLANLYVRWRSPERQASGTRMRLHGWPVLLMQWLRSVFLFTVVSVIAVSILRPHARLFQDVLPWMYVSVTAAVGGVLGRHWLRGVRAMQCLPIRRSTLALILCIVLVTPAAVASAAATAVNAIEPQWGLVIPFYMLPIFGLVPTLAVWGLGVQANHPVPNALHQWVPTLQLLSWPVSIGSGMSVFMKWWPTWFAVVIVGLAVLMAVVAYLTVLWRIRAGATLEQFGDSLTPR